MTRWLSNVFRLGAALQAFQTQIEARHRVGAAADEAIVRLADALFVVQLAFVQFAALAAIDEQVVLHFDPLDQECDALAGYALPGAEFRPHQRRRIHGVGPQHPRLGEQHLHSTPLHPQHSA